MINKKGQTTVIVIIAAVLLLSAGLFTLYKYGVFGQAVTSSTFTPVYCNSYEFNSCAETGLNGGTPTSQQFTFTSGKDSVNCPLGSTTKCVVNSINNGGSALSQNPILYDGDQNCAVKSTFFGLGSAFSCDNGHQVYATSTVGKGSFLYAYQGIPVITYTIYEQHLFFTGTSFATGGVPVQGADGCTFQTDKSIYNSAGNVVKSTSGSTISYTVPTNQAILSWTGQRSICGNLEEQCTSDSSCGGHTYGNVECSARTKQTYGCKQLALPSGVSSVSGTLTGSNYALTDKNNDPTNANQYSGVTARCEIQSAQTVQCCGDTDCGSGAVCDTNPSSPNAFTCQAPSQVQCKQNSDCGVSTQCNIATKQIVTPTCVVGVCQQSNTKQVQCCSSQDCASGSFCDYDGSCKQSSNPLVNTPFECSPRANSDDKTKYFDKPCPTGKMCTEEGTCKDITAADTIASKTLKSIFWLTFGLIFIGAFITIFIWLPIDNKWIKALIAGILALILAYVMAYLVTLVAKLVINISKGLGSLFS